MRRGEGGQAEEVLQPTWGHETMKHGRDVVLELDQAGAGGDAKGGEVLRGGQVDI